MSRSNDRQLVAQCLCGCQSAWQELYARLETTVNYIVRWSQWSLNPQQMEEVRQEALNSFVASLKTFDFNCSLETYASTITKNKCISEIRRQSAAKRAGERFAVSVLRHDSVAGLEENDERRLLFEEDRRSIEQALDQLGENCRTILRMKYYNDYSYKQIAEKLNIPQGTVSSRLKRSLQQLKRAWEKNAEDL